MASRRSSKSWFSRWASPTVIVALILGMVGIDLPVNGNDGQQLQTLRRLVVWVMGGQMPNNGANPVVNPVPNQVPSPGPVVTNPNQAIPTNTTGQDSWFPVPTNPAVPTNPVVHQPVTTPPVVSQPVVTQPAPSVVQTPTVPTKSGGVQSPNPRRGLHTVDQSDPAGASNGNVAGDRRGKRRHHLHRTSTTARPVENVADKPKPTVKFNPDFNPYR